MKVTPSLAIEFLPHAWVLVAACTMTTSFARAQLPPVPVPPQNPITEPKRILGKVLFWDEQLSTSNTVSCGTCHAPARGGAEPRPAAIHPGTDGITPSPDDIRGSPGVSLSDINNDYVQSVLFGTQPQVTNRTANSFINAGYSPDLFWDGRARSQFIDPQTGTVVIPNGGALESQTLAPPLSSVEMAHEQLDWDAVTEKLRTVRPLDLATNIPPDVLNEIGGPGNRVSYQELFRRAFGDPAITARRIAFAIATYERTLVSNQTPWDRFIAGETTALTPNQQQGWALFQGAARCNVCHTAPLFSDNTFRNIGVRPIGEDNGRQAVTNNPADAGRFKVPSLRNVGLRANFMHNGQFTTIAQVMGFYAQGPGAPPSFPQNRDPVFGQIVLPPQNAQLIDDFIRNGLTDPRVAAEQFPFDRPTLAQQRAIDRPSVLANTGVAGTGGQVPQIIVQSPGLLGSLSFRVGVSGALAGAQAQLGISRTPPVNGRISTQNIVGSKITSGSGGATGLATVHLPINVRDFAPGEVLFFQWFITDPLAPGGLAHSTVGRVPVFCGSGGCPPLCDSIDFNRDGLFPDTADLDDFLLVFSGGPCSNNACGDIDFNNDGLYPDTDDLDAFLFVFSGGACP